MRWFSNWARALLEKIRFPWIHKSIRLKILVAFLGLSLVPMIGLGLINFEFGKNVLMKQAARKLEAVRALKADKIQSWFEERRSDIAIISENPAVIDNMIELEDGYKKLGENASKYIRDRYLGRSEIVHGGDTSEYSKAHQELHGMMKEALEFYGYSDFFMVTLNGDVLYSVNKNEIYGTNLASGRFKDTGLSKIFDRTLNSQFDDYVTVEDYTFIASNDHPSAYIASPMFTEYFDLQEELFSAQSQGATPEKGKEGEGAKKEKDIGTILKKGRIIGVLIFELPIKRINEIMSDRTGMGYSGETYIIGPDRLWRTESRYSEALGGENTILNTQYRVDTASVDSALSGASGTEITTDYRGEKVLSSWEPLVIEGADDGNSQGLTWALVSEIDIKEVREPVYQLAKLTAVVIAFAVMVVVLLAYLLTGGITDQILKINTVFNEIGIGNFDARVEIVSEDELGRMAAGLNAMLDNTLTLIQSEEERDAIQTAIVRLLDEISMLTEGDLTVRAEVSEEITGAIADAFNELAAQLSHIIRNVKLATQQVGDTARDVTDITRQLSKYSQVQSRQISETIDIIDDLNASIRKIDEQSKESASVSERSKMSAREGAMAVQNTNKAMNLIRERVQETARVVKRLGESSQEIGNIIQIIDDIADRTSILALNASIQAATAGDAGRGFAIVAGEVQRLAEISANSTKQIEKLVKNIQSEINEVGTSIEYSIQRVVEGTKLAENAHSKLMDIESVSSVLAEHVQFITSMTADQSKSSEIIARKMESVVKLSVKTSAISSQTVEAMEKMVNTSDTLRVSVSEFRLQEEELFEEDKCT